MCYMPLEFNEDVIICGARQALSCLQNTGSHVGLEITLGILSNLSRNHSAIHKALRNLDDFDLLRKLLLRIMEDDTSKQMEIVLSMSIIYHLFGITDRFFDNRNINTSLQVLFNIFLKGNSLIESSYAGDILIDFCNNSSSFSLIKSHSGLKQTIEGAVGYILSGDSKLIYKFLWFLSSLLKRDSDLTAFVKSLVFKSSSQEGSYPVLSAIANHLTDMRDHLLSASAARFLFELLSYSAIDFENSNMLTQLLEITSHSLSICSESWASVEVMYRQRLIMHCSSLIIQRVSQLCCSMDGESIDISGGHVAHLGQLAESFAWQNLEKNVQLTNILIPTPNSDIEVAENGQLVASMLLTIDALDLLLTCTDFLSVASPVSATQKSQENMDPDETRIDCTLPGIENLRINDDAICSNEGGSLIAGHLHRCGNALQRCLEAAPLPPILALTLVIGNGRGDSESNFSSRAVVLRLLKIALNLQNFSSTSFLYTLNSMLPPGCRSLEDYVESRLLSVTKKSEKYGSKSTLSTFISEWIVSTQQHCQTKKQRANELNVKKPHYCPESTINKLCAALDNSALSFASIAGSEAMTICQQKIELLQSRESVLEAEVAAKREALRTADALAEHYRSRSVIAEGEVRRLLQLQTTALAVAESQRIALDSERERAFLHKEEVQRLSEELASKKKECEALLTVKNSLQSKLTNMREQNRTMDATIEHFRKQLDEAKQVIDQKDAEILQYNNMARIINELTGKVQPANLSNSKNT
nr:protein CIP2A [Hymenolepis microstoma]